MMALILLGDNGRCFTPTLANENPGYSSRLNMDMMNYLIVPIQPKPVILQISAAQRNSDVINPRNDIVTVAVP